MNAEDATREARIAHSEHEVMMQMVHEFRRYLDQGLELGDLRYRLMNWCQAHFSSEDDLMRAQNYPEIDDHAAHHRAMLAMIGGLVGRNEIDVLLRTMVSHINERDARLHAFLEQR